MILKSSQHHPRVWGTEPNFHDAVLLGFEGVGQETHSLQLSFSLSSPPPFLSFPFWVPLRRVGVKGTSSFPCDEHKSCFNRIQTWGNWWVPAADRLHKRCWHTGRQQQVLIKPQTPTPSIHSLSLFPSTSLARSLTPAPHGSVLTRCQCYSHHERRQTLREVKEKRVGGRDRQVGGQERREVKRNMGK